MPQKLFERKALKINKFLKTNQTSEYYENL